MGYELGVDLGTTYSAAAVRRGDVVSMLGLGNRAMQIPSVLYLQPDGSFLVGEAAEARASAEPDRIAREFKRRLGDPVPVIVGGTPFSAELLTARLLTWIVGVATEREGEAPDKVTVSYPANWSAYKIDLLRQAFTLANLPDVTTCTEPEAAAITYATRQRVPEGGHVAVYDLGGGTFDAAVLRHDGDRFTLVGRPEGIEHLGGVDFDEAVFQHVVRTLRTELAGLDADDPATIRGLDRLRRDCVVAKETLSTDTEARLSVTIGRVDTVVRLTRSEFEDMIRPALGETVSAMERVLRSAGVEPQQLDTILLVGGSSRIPLVSEVLSSSFGRPLALDAHPKHEVATGAAWLTGALPQLAPASPVGNTEPTYPALAATADTDVHDRSQDLAGDTSRQARPAARSWWTAQRAWLVGGAVAVVAAVLAVVLLAGGDSGGKAPTAGQSTFSGGVSSRVTSPNATSSVPSGDQSKSVEPIVASRPLGPRLTDNVVLWAATRNGEKQIWRGTSSGGDQRPAVPGSNNYQESISHDRRTIAYVHQTGDLPSVWLAGSDGKHARPLFASAPAQCPGALRPAFSPDDKILAVPCQVAPPNQSRWSIYLVDPTGKILGSARATGFIGDPSFDPTGTKIAFWEASNVGHAIDRIDVATVSGPRRVTPLTKWIQGANDPTFSPVNGNLAIKLGLDNACEIYLLNPSSKALTRLTRNNVAEQDPSWSVDGTAIAYKRGPADNADIWRMSSTGGNQKGIVTDGQPDSTPAWASR